MYASEDAAAILQYEANFSVDLEAKAAVSLHALPDGDVAAFNAQSRRWFKVIPAFLLYSPFTRPPGNASGNWFGPTGVPPTARGRLR